jgi:hypothetical protein
MLVYWGLVSLPCPLCLGQGHRSISWLPAVSVLCWFGDCFSILQCCLTLDVAQWLRRWDLWTVICPISGSSLSPAHCQPICLSSLCLLKVRMEISSLLLPASPVHLEHPTPFAALFQFLVYYSVFFAGMGVSLSRVLCWFILGVSVGILSAAYLLTCWSAGCLPSRFGAGIWQHGSLPVFSVLHRVEKLCMGWGFRVLMFWFSLVLFFCLVLLQHLSEIFDLRSSWCLFLHCSCHLRSLSRMCFLSIPSQFSNSWSLKNIQFKIQINQYFNLCWENTVRKYVQIFDLIFQA